ncbi:MAG: CHRD domain-containing protein [Planctomycetota bacterium]|nr:CHRD domain-containing protein [Planctomycetota bacterium]
MNMPRVAMFALVLTALFGAADSANAAVHYYQAFLDGPSEFPANASPGTGYGTFDYDDTLHTLAIAFDFQGLTGTTTAAHLHAPTTIPGSGAAGVASTTPYFAGFPVGVTSGTYSNVLDLTLASSYNASFITANGGTTATAEAALAAFFAAEKSYLNIHTSTFGGGEIRGFLVPVPEPSTLLLGGIGLITAVGYAVRHRRIVSTN